MNNSSTTPPNPRGPSALKNAEDNWITDMGAWFPAERVVLRGKDVFSELKDFTWMEYLLLGITGTHLPKAARITQGMWMLSTSFPDPRLWNNRVAALGGTTRTTGILSLAAANAVSEATVYGAKPIKSAMEFLLDCAKRRDDGENLETIIKQELKTNRCVAGFGRPLVDRDERIQPVMKLLASENADQGKFIRLAFEIDDYFRNTRYGFRMNIAALNAAAAADTGLTPDQYYHATSLAFVAGIIPCFIDASSRGEGEFFPLSVARLNSANRAIRKWGSS